MNTAVATIGGGENWLSESKKNYDADWGNRLYHWFEPSIYSYAFFQEFPLEMIVEEAKDRGIPTEGRSKIEIARDMYRLSGDLWEETKKEK